MKSKETINATPNHKNRTFTIRITNVESDGRVFKTKYRTIPLPSEEFNSCLYNTQIDWQNFLRSDDYYLVRKQQKPIS